MFLERTQILNRIRSQSISSRCCGNERNSQKQFKRDLFAGALNLRPALEHCRRKRRPSASILLTHTKLVCVLPSKCRRESDLGLCTTSDLQKECGCAVAVATFDEVTSSSFGLLRQG